MSEKDIENRFGFHAPMDAAKQFKHDLVRALFTKWAEHLVKNVPVGSPHTEKALDALELASMYAQKAVAQGSPLDRRMVEPTFNVFTTIELASGASEVPILMGSREGILEWIRVYRERNADFSRTYIQAADGKTRWTIEQFLGLSTPETSAPPLLAD